MSGSLRESGPADLLPLNAVRITDIAAFVSIKCHFIQHFHFKYYSILQRKKKNIMASTEILSTTTVTLIQQH